MAFLFGRTEPRSLRGPAGFSRPGQPRRLSLRERFCELGCGVAAGAEAGGDADSAISVSGEREAGQLLPHAVDAVDAIEMSDAVLRHGRLPSVDAGKYRLPPPAQEFLQFFWAGSAGLSLYRG